MKLPAFLLMAVPILPLISSEYFSYRWMNPPSTAETAPYPVLTPLVQDSAFTLLPSDYNEVKGPLHCSSGWMGSLGDGNNPVLRLAWFEWNETSTMNTLEAFKHLPDQCMGSAGKHLEKVNPPRVFGGGDKQFVFDSTRFTTPDRKAQLFVFKAVWVSGWAGAELRSGTVDGVSSRSLRKLRLACAKNRFRPEKTRVLMAVVSGFPTESMAWNWFSEKALGNISWNDGANPREESDHRPPSSS